MAQSSRASLVAFAEVLETVKQQEESYSDDLNTSDEEGVDSYFEMEDPFFANLDEDNREDDCGLYSMNKEVKVEIKMGEPLQPVAASSQCNIQTSSQTGFECKVCHKQFRQKYHLKSHSQVHEVKETVLHECGLCKINVKTRNTPENPMATHTDAKLFSFEHCGKNLKLEQTLKSHKHVSQTPDLDFFHCSMCNKTFKQQISLIKHMEMHKKDRFPCKMCDKSFSFQSALKRHQQLHIQEGSNQSLLSCEVCQKSFSRASCLRLHMQVHLGTQQFVCSFCEAPFSRKTDLERHVYIHTGERPYKCSLCPRAFCQPGELGRHRDWHRGKNTCQYCGKRYVRKDELRRHMLEHELEAENRPESLLQCFNCKKVLSCEVNLKKHLRTCSGERKTFKCQMCGLEFKHNSNYHRHMREIHLNDNGRNQESPVRTYNCDICSKTYRSKRSLKDHINFEHLKKFKHVCRICDMNFYKAVDLVKHNKRKH